MTDARWEKSRIAIKKALLSLLEEASLDSVTMAALAQKARISRSTLYMHYANPQEVFDELVIEFHSGLRSLQNQLQCSKCKNLPEFHSDGDVPFCLALRNAGIYAPLVKDPRYLPTMFEVALADASMEGQLAPYLEAGLGRYEAEQLFRFQISGCYNAAMSAKSGESWARMQSVIDAFIAGGLEALSANRRR